MAKDRPTPSLIERLCSRRISPHLLRQEADLSDEALTRMRNGSDSVHVTTWRRILRTLADYQGFSRAEIDAIHSEVGLPKHAIAEMNQAAGWVGSDDRSAHDRILDVLDEYPDHAEAIADVVEAVARALDV